MTISEIHLKRAGNLESGHTAAAKCVVYAAVVVLCSIVYAMPYAFTWRSCEFTDLPPVFRPDQFFYLNLASLQETRPGVVRNPWYGIETAKADIPHARFGAALRCFGVLRASLGRSLALTTIVWVLAVVAAIAVAGAALFASDRASSPVAIATSVFLLLLVNFSELPGMVSALFELPSLAGFEGLSLPFSRLFYPQFAVPFVVVYLVAQSRVVGEAKLGWWICMWFSQLVVLAAFPYGLPVVALGTLISFLGAGFGCRSWSEARRVGLFALACAVADGVLLISQGGVKLDRLLHSDATVFDFDVDRIATLPRGSVAILGLVASLLLVRRFVKDPAVAWSVAGFAFSVLVWMLSDVALSRFLQMGTHAAYLHHLALACAVGLLIGPALRALAHRPHWARLAAWALCVGVVAYGCAVASGMHRRMLSFNREQSELTAVLASLGLTDRDLVVAKATFGDDAAAWMPLMFPATTLFCRHAEYVLSPELAGIQRERQAWYLYLTGFSSKRVRAALIDGGGQEPFDRPFLLPGRLSPVALDARYAGSVARFASELVPRLEDVEARGIVTDCPFREAEHVWFVDRADAPLFDDQRVRASLEVVDDWVAKGIRVRRCLPR